MSKLTYILWVALLAFACCSRLAEAVKREDFQTCGQSGFCTRQRSYADLADIDESYKSSWKIISDSLILSNDLSTIQLIVESSIYKGKQFIANFNAFQYNSIHFVLQEKSINRNRFNISNAPFNLLNNTLNKSKFNVDEKKEIELKDGKWIIPLQDINVELHIVKNPYFQFYLTKDNEPIYQFNSLGYLNYETSNMKEHNSFVESINDDQKVLNNENDKDLESLKKDLKKSIYKSLDKETFKSFTDTKPNGPESIGFDIIFSKTSHSYGLAEHGAKAQLQSTRKNQKFNNNNPIWNTEPYRLYNVDIFEYEHDSSMALYGAVPFILAHEKNTTSGVFWKNAADMWVDVEVFEKEKGKSNPDHDSVHTHWISETGDLDLIFYIGSNPKEVSNSFTASTQRAILPPLFSIGHHQCRWNYIDENDVLSVNKEFNNHDIPYDVIWLDIEFTDGKRYFTWDDSKFSKPVEMQNKLNDDGRKLVIIIDPHIKKDDDYIISEEIRNQDLTVKNNKKELYDGWCWPGNSNWIDYLNPKSKEYWSNKFKINGFLGNTKNLYVWNDMNEPSVFNGPEISFPKDNLHINDIEHREVHNIYGYLMQASTYEGLLKRSNNEERPFILSRSFFAGSQSVGAIWTGDNQAKWEFLRLSNSMLLSLGISGITFSGSDVGGFFGDPEIDLLIRWYQVGIFNPFFRAHAHIDTKRREPWVFGEPYSSYIREAIRLRYRLLPYLYGLFYESTQLGTPIVRPMFYEFPKLIELFDLENQYMFGESLLVNPIVYKDQDIQKTILPFNDELIRWYLYDRNQTFEEIQNDFKSTNEVLINHELKQPIGLEWPPMYIKGGTILIEATRDRRSASLTIYDPIKLIIALNSNQESKGYIYKDDGIKMNPSFVKGDFEFKTNRLDYNKIDSNKESDFKIDLYIEEIIILGINSNNTIKTCRFKSSISHSSIELQCSPYKTNHLKLKIPPNLASLLTSKHWTISFSE